MNTEELVARTVKMPGANNDAIEAYLAVPASEGSHPGIVVIHHMPGYDWATKEIIRRLATFGYSAICPNLYYRQAPDATAADAAAAVRAEGGVSDDQLVGDVAGAINYLKALPTASGRVGTIGFCSGGRQALLAASRLAMDAVVDCYGSFVVNAPPDSLGLNIGPIVDEMGGLSCPLLGIFGVEDTNPSPAQVQVLGAALDAHCLQHDFETYDDAGHAFLAVDRAHYRPQAALGAWARIAEFLNRYLVEVA